MALDYKIYNIREKLIECNPCTDREKQILESIIDVLQDISTELNELNESLMC